MLWVPEGFQCTWVVSEIKFGIHRGTITIPDPLGCWKQRRSPKEQSHAVPRGESASLATIPCWRQLQRWTSALQAHPASEKGVWHVLLSHQDHDKEKAQKPNRFSTRKEPRVSNPFIFTVHLLCTERRNDELRGRLLILPWAYTFESLLRNPNCTKWPQINYHHSGTLLAFIDCIA